MITAFTAGAEELPPDPGTFLQEATNALKVDFPACILDSLFFIRAWNSYAVELEQPPGIVRPEVHPFAMSLSPVAVQQWNEADESASHRAWRRIQEFWLLTASLCGTEAYKRLVNSLKVASPVFCERWLASDQAPSDLARPVGTTYFVTGPRGRYRLVPLTIVLPPVYHLRLYMPDDSQTEMALSAAKAKGQPTVHVNPSIHWSLTPTTEPGA